MEKIATSANELVELRPDAILGVTTPAIGALARKTKTIPLVFNLVADPIGNGFAASLTHPGGNITGFAAYDPAVAEMGGITKAGRSANQAHSDPV